MTDVLLARFRVGSRISDDVKAAPTTVEVDQAGGGAVSSSHGRRKYCSSFVHGSSDSAFTAGQNRAGAAGDEASTRRCLVNGFNIYCEI